MADPKNPTSGFGLFAPRIWTRWILLPLMLSMTGCAAAEDSLVALGYWVFLVFGVMLCTTVLSARVTQLPFYKTLRKKLRKPATWSSGVLALAAAGCVSIGATRADYAALLLPIGLVLGVAAIATLVWARATRDQTHAVAARMIAICFAFAATLITLMIYAKN